MDIERATDLYYGVLNFFYTLAEGIMISVRSLQRREGDDSDPIKYIYSYSASLDESI